MKKPKEGIYMPQSGDIFIATLNRASLEWGTFRRRPTRNRIMGERYIPIRRREAVRIGIYNSNYGNGLGINIFNARSTDNLYEGQLKAAGCKNKGDGFAKQFQGNGDLRALYPWFTQRHAQVGDQVQIRWTSNVDIELTFISNHQ